MFHGHPIVLYIRGVNSQFRQLLGDTFYQWFTWNIGSSQWRNPLSPRQVSPSTLTELGIIALLVINPAIPLTQDEEGSVLILLIKNHPTSGRSLELCSIFCYNVPYLNFTIQRLISIFLQTDSGFVRVYKNVQCQNIRMLFQY